MPKTKRRGNLANFGARRAIPFGRKGGGTVPGSKRKPNSRRASK